MIYLVRHGEIVTQKEHRCIGRTDVPLSEYGAGQMELLGGWFAKQMAKPGTDFGNKIYTSPLVRCCDSAKYLADGIARLTGRQIELVVCENLQEISMGAWDGLRFQEIKENFPKEYEERGENIGEFRVETAETYIESGERFLAELKRLVKVSGNKDMILISHAGVIRAALCLIESREMKKAGTIMGIRQPNAGITKLSYQEKNGDVVFKVENVGFRPVQLLDENEIKRIYEKYSVPDHIVAHMRAVAQVQDKILQKIDCRGEDYDHEVLKKAALLHDIARLHKEHARLGAELLEKEGYDEIVPLIASHHSPDNLNKSGEEMTILTAADVLYYADKVVQGEKEVGIEERFRTSLKKCTTAEAVYKHDQLYKRAKRIKKQIGMNEIGKSE